MRKALGNIILFIGYAAILFYLGAYAAEYFGFIELGLVELARTAHSYIPAARHLIPEFTPLALPLLAVVALGLWIKGEF